MHVDVLVIGSGPSGQQAALQARRAGRSVVVVEKDSTVGGACVHRGTIPSKTLRETAVYLAGLPKRTAGNVEAALDERTRLESLMSRLDHVVASHTDSIAATMARAGVQVCRGRARFVSPHAVEVTQVRGKVEQWTADVIVVAAGSRPRAPEGIPVDHEHVLDSDSVLAMVYLPRSLTVLGGGVIASEYASIFACLGVATTIVDKAPRPLAFLDHELSEAFVQRFDNYPGCRYLGGQQIEGVSWEGIGRVATRLAGGTEVVSEKVLCALGRVPNLEALDVAAAGLRANARGFLEVDPYGRTSVPHIYAVGDVVGPPALASSALAQGRRAVCHALSLAQRSDEGAIPTGIYTVPEMAAIGLTEAQARETHADVRVGRASFAEVARGHISAGTDGLLKLVVDGGGGILGAHILGEGATELIHLAQLAMAGGQNVDVFVDNVFNFPTLAEAYRVAAERLVDAAHSAPV
ncbi:MAG: Si-specific NAD(P)(+) transhydrogenase [Planctomycetota bacterium]